MRHRKDFRKCFNIVAESRNNTTPAFVKEDDMLKSSTRWRTADQSTTATNALADNKKGLQNDDGGSRQCSAVASTKTESTSYSWSLLQERGSIRRSINNRVTMIGRDAVSTKTPHRASVPRKDPCGDHSVGNIFAMLKLNSSYHF